MTTYLLRLNLDIKERNFKEQLRFKLAAESIKSLSKKTNKVIILSHLGRPKSAEKDLSLRRFTPALSAMSGKKVQFISHFNFPQIKKEVNSAPGGSVFLLENLRFLPGETKNSKTLAKNLAALGNHYINNDFANSHRGHASMSAITKFLPSTASPILKKEIQALTKIKTAPRHPFVLIIGGAKMADKISVIKNLLPLADYVLVGGGPANNFLKTKGVNIGSSIYEPRLLSATRILARNKKVIIPVDWQKEGGRILDIGPETIKLFAGIMAEARTIIWNGPMGYFENKKFATGTINIAKATLKNKKAKTVIGGGETIAALPFKINQQQYGKIFIS
ncbi:MAG: phosphoglycerate kinase, partial [Candidatus Colwellbacteria bacterium]|nr:phosphoglycerate kinase [Candidatus Colwellbacteria bacterium]